MYIEWFELLDDKTKWLFLLPTVFEYSLRFKIKVTFGLKLRYELKVIFGKISLKVRQMNWNVDELPNQITVYTC
jgi:hypothetical protein